MNTQKTTSEAEEERCCHEVKRRNRDEQFEPENRRSQMSVDESLSAILLRRKKVQAVS
jgi:hypothetical protein